jgi:hypothetical protein
MNIGPIARDGTKNNSKGPTMDEEDLMENIFDAVAASRYSITCVRSTKQTQEGSQTYYCTFLLNVDNKSHDALCAIAGADKADERRSVAKVLRRYIVACFKACIERDQDDAEPEKQAA